MKDRRLLALVALLLIALLIGGWFLLRPASPPKQVAASAPTVAAPSERTTVPQILSPEGGKPAAADPGKFEPRLVAAAELPVDKLLLGFRALYFDDAARTERTTSNLRWQRLQLQGGDTYAATTLAAVTSDPPPSALPKESPCWTMRRGDLAAGSAFHFDPYNFVGDCRQGPIGRAGTAWQAIPQRRMAELREGATRVTWADAGWSKPETWRDWPLRQTGRAPFELELLGERVRVPALRAKGDPVTDARGQVFEYEFTILDHPEMALLLEVATRRVDGHEYDYNADKKEYFQRRGSDGKVVRDWGDTWRLARIATFDGAAIERALATPAGLDWLPFTWSDGYAAADRWVLRSVIDGAACQALAEAMARNPSWRLILRGHRDAAHKSAPIAPAASLSLMAAGVVRDHLAMAGIPADRMLVEDAGTDRPTDEKRAIPRAVLHNRVELLLQR